VVISEAIVIRWSGVLLSSCHTHWEGSFNQWHCTSVCLSVCLSPTLTLHL